MSRRAGSTLSKSLQARNCRFVRFTFIAPCARLSGAIRAASRVRTVEQGKRSGARGTRLEKILRRQSLSITEHLAGTFQSFSYEAVALQR